MWEVSITRNLKRSQWSCCRTGVMWPFGSGIGPRGRRSQDILYCAQQGLGHLRRSGIVCYVFGKYHLELKGLTMNIRGPSVIPRGMAEACGNGCVWGVLTWIVFLCPCSFFGHFSHRSEWQLIKIDYKSIYSRKCTEEDYQTWHLHNQVRKPKMLYVIVFGNKNTLNNCSLILLTGWTLCDGTKTNFHEEKAWKLLHAGKGLLQNPLSRTLYLPSSRFWMVRWGSHSLFFYFSSQQLPATGFSQQPPLHNWKQWTWKDTTKTDRSPGRSGGQKQHSCFILDPELQ